MIFGKFCLDPAVGVRATDETPSTTGIVNGAAYLDDESGLSYACIDTGAVADSDSIIGGFRYTSAGALRVSDVTAGLPASSSVNQGILMTDDGQVCFSTAAGGTVLNGVSLTDDGAVSMAVMTFLLEFADLGSGEVDTTATFGGVSATFTRAGATAWTRDSTGAWIGPIAANTPRSYYSADGVYLGYLAEGARINHFLNSAAPVTQTSPSLGTGFYTLWMEGAGSVAVAANTATITGAGTATDGTPVTFEVTGAGTVDYTVTGSPDRVQSENGAFASSYIETAGASVTRNADALTYPTTGWLNAAAGTVSMQLVFNGSVADNRAGVINDGGGNNRILWRATGSNSNLFINNGGVQQVSISDGSVVVGDVTKLAVAFEDDNFAVVANGGTVESSSSGTLPSGMTTLYIGYDASGGSAVFGPIRRVAYYNTRLPNATLQALTD